MMYGVGNHEKCSRIYDIKTGCHVFVNVYMYVVRLINVVVVLNRGASPYAYYLYIPRDSRR